MFLTGALSTGAVFGLATFLTAALIQGASTTYGSAVAQGTLVGLMFGMPVAAVTAAVPGAILGLVLQRRELGARFKAQAHEMLVDHYVAREDLRQRLRAGHITPGQAVDELCHFAPDDYQTTRTTAPLQVDPPAPAPLPAAGEPVTPLDVMVLASAVADHTGGYQRTELGAGSTPATVLRILHDASAPERFQIRINQHNHNEGMDAFGWTMRAYEENDPYRQRVGAQAVKPVLSSNETEAITLVASAVGGLRRAKAAGLA